MNKRKLYYLECNLAGRQYHEANDVWNELKVGTKLCLMRERDNRYDPNAIAVGLLGLYHLSFLILLNSLRSMFAFL